MTTRDPPAYLPGPANFETCNRETFIRKNKRRDTTLMTNYLELPVGSNSPEVINAVIEIPYEGVNKYEYDKELHVFRLDRNLYSPVHYPGDYGFLPSTLADDGDPLDCLVLVDAPSFSGCVMQVRPIGMLEMLDQGLGDEKVLCVGKNNPRYKDVWNFSEIYPHMLREITHFFSIYKDLEGKRVEVKGWRDASFARTKVLEAQQNFIENKTNPKPKPVPHKIEQTADQKRRASD
jgi:inorganic pyrophosphatase